MSIPDFDPTQTGPVQIRVGLERSALKKVSAWPGAAQNVPIW